MVVKHDKLLTAVGTLIQWLVLDKTVMYVVSAFKKIHVHCHLTAVVPCQRTYLTRAKCAD